MWGRERYASRSCHVVVVPQFAAVVVRMIRKQNLNRTFYSPALFVAFHFLFSTPSARSLAESDGEEPADTESAGRRGPSRRPARAPLPRSGRFPCLQSRLLRSPTRNPSSKFIWREQKIRFRSIVFLPLNYPFIWCILSIWWQAREEMSRERMRYLEAMVRFLVKLGV